MTRFVDELRDLALDHPDKPYLGGAADAIEQLTRDLKVSRQDNGAVIAQLQNDIREARAGIIPGLEEAIRVIEGMNTDWPDAIGRSLGDDYGRQFASRIRDRIELIKRAEREQCARIAESFASDCSEARRIAEVIRRRSRSVVEP
jgi:hypothetical protein